MIIRDVTQNDIKTIGDIEYDFVPPNLDSCSIKASIYDKEGLISVSAIKIVGEISIMHNKNVNNIRIAKSMVPLFKEAIYRCNKANINTLYSFTNNLDWTNQIKKHFGFRDIRHQNKLVLEF